MKNIPSWWDNIPDEFIINRSYHTTWQSFPGMRFKLIKVDGDRALLGTNGSTKTYWSRLSDLRDTQRNRIK